MGYLKITICGFLVVVQMGALKRRITTEINPFEPKVSRAGIYTRWCVCGGYTAHYYVCLSA